MRFDLGREALRILELEEELLASPVPSFPSSFERWSLEQTVNHVSAWREIAIGKVEGRIGLGAGPAYAGRSIEEINARVYEETRGLGREETLLALRRGGRRMAALLSALGGRLEEEEAAPQGFKGSAFDYLKGDLVYHPISHYLYFAVRNADLASFRRIEKHLSEARDGAFAELGLLDIAEMAAPARLAEYFDRGEAWEAEPYFLQVKRLALPPA